MTELRGRVAVVTGGGSGIGRAIAAALVDAGAEVAVADIDLASATETAAEIGAAPFAVDVTSRESFTELASAVEAQFGRVDLLVNNAGVASIAPLAEMTKSDWDWLLSVNLYGAINGVSVFLPLLEANPDGGHILNTGSMAGIAPDAGMGGYGVTKFAMTAFTEVLSAELAERNVRVSILLPGPIRTRLGSSSRNRPVASSGALHDVDLAAGDGGGLNWLDPSEAAAAAVDAIRHDRLYAVTHRDMLPIVEARHRAIEAAFEIREVKPAE